MPRAATRKKEGEKLEKNDGPTFVGMLITPVAVAYKWASSSKLGQLAMLSGVAGAGYYGYGLVNKVRLANAQEGESSIATTNAHDRMRVDREIPVGLDARLEPEYNDFLDTVSDAREFAEKIVSKIDTVKNVVTSASDEFVSESIKPYTDAMGEIVSSSAVGTAYRLAKGIYAMTPEVQESKESHAVLVDVPYSPAPAPDICEWTPPPNPEYTPEWLPMDVDVRGKRSLKMRNLPYVRSKKRKYNIY